VIYTDGAVNDRHGPGGAGCVVTRGSASAPTTLFVARSPAGEFASSTQAELVGIEFALNWLKANRAEWNNVLICVDSKAALEILAHPTPASSPLSNHANAVKSKWDPSWIDAVRLVWIPGHIGLFGNELADVEAKGRCLLDQSKAIISFGAAKAAIKQTVKKKFCRTWHSTIINYGD
jgi:ribonuclease HI